MDVRSAKEHLAKVCHLAYLRNYICGMEGNFSIRLADNLVLATPAGVCKGMLGPDELLLTDMKGEMVEPTGRDLRPSTELAMHLACYNVRADIKAVVHAHPTTAVGFTVAKQSLLPCILPEVVCTVGTIPTAPYATPSTDEVSLSIRPLIAEYDAIMLDHHGALTVGSDIWDAFFKLETLEHHAQTMLVAKLLGGEQRLQAEQIKRLLAIRSTYGLTNPLKEEMLTGPACAETDHNR
jgi:L-fuculose-phosphate aldolase